MANPSTDTSPADRPDEVDEVDDDEGGQVSEVGRMDAAAASTPISDDQSVAGSPSDESGHVQEGRTGPNARTGSQPGD